MRFKDVFLQIINDNTSGSTRILDTVTMELIKYLNKCEKPDLSEITETLGTLNKKLPYFTVLNHFIGYFLNIIFICKNESLLNSNEKKKYLLDAIDEYVLKWKDIYKENALKIIQKINFHDKSILLHSNSSGIQQLFKQLSNKNIPAKVFQTSSEPVKEGKIQAEILLSFGFKVTFIQEAACSRFTEQIDCAIFGADSIYKNCFVNKIGTFQLCLLFKYFKKPVYVLADKRKLIQSKIDLNSPIEGLKPSAELWSDPPHSIIPQNFYFELIPNDLVSDFFI